MPPVPTPSVGAHDRGTDDEAIQRYKEDLTLAERSVPLVHSIDPGFVHHRKIEAYLGRGGMKIVDEHVSRLPEGPEELKQVRIDHVYS